MYRGTLDKEGSVRSVDRYRRSREWRRPSDDDYLYRLVSALGVDADRCRFVDTGETIDDALYFERGDAAIDTAVLNRVVP